MDRYSDLVTTRFDLIVIGAGINGVAIARDAAMRGLRVLVVDKHDIASGTTSWSTRLIHGGLRYLEHREFGLVRESLRERERLLRNAPHLVAPLPLILPLYEESKRGPALIRIGMGLYDALSFDKSLPRHKMLSRAETLRRIPGLDPDGLKAGARYYDAQVTFPERLAVEITRSAKQHGARVETYSKVVKMLTEGSIATGVEIIDEQTGERATVRGRAIMNVSGPWVDELLAELPADRRPSRQMGGTKGSHLVVPPFPGAPEEALYVEAKSDGRAMFIIPWNRNYLIGTTDFRYEGDLDAVHADADEVAYLLAETNALFPEAKLTVDDVAFTYSGVRPLPYTASGSAGAISRDHQVKSHAPQVQGLWSVIGGKLTTHRQLAEEAVDIVCNAFGIKAKSETASKPLPGAAGIVAGSFAEALQRDSKLPPAVTTRLVQLYGALAEEIVALAQQKPELAEIIDEEQGLIAAEVVYAFQSEGARTLEDALMRRTMLALNPGMAIGIDERVAAVAGRHLGWSADRQAAEVRAYRERIAPFFPKGEPVSV
jgi:glycerol-3-phosphate dehydrogenase